jgi:hypothetical protein
MGDVNGDGKSDLIGVGAPGLGNAGTVYVALSNGTGFNFWSWNSAPGVISNGSPLLMGDVNGDGKSDLIGVGAPGLGNAGTVYVALSNGTGFNFWSWNSAPGVISNGSPLLMGDVNGDKKSDLIGVGAANLGNAGIVYAGFAKDAGQLGFTFWSTCK